MNLYVSSALENRLLPDYLSVFSINLFKALLIILINGFGELRT
jgi:hypothetical protein